MFTLHSVKISRKATGYFSLRSVKIHATQCTVHYEAWKFGYTGQMATLDAPKLLMLTNRTKLTRTVALTLTDTVTVIFFTSISLTPIKRLYRNNKINFCGGAVAGSWVGLFFPFSDFLPVCWQEFDSKFILYHWKRVFLWGYIRKMGKVFWGHKRKKETIRVACLTIFSQRRIVKYD